MKNMIAKGGCISCICSTSKISIGLNILHQSCVSTTSFRFSHNGVPKPSRNRNTQNLIQKNIAQLSKNISTTNLGKNDLLNHRARSIIHKIPATKIKEHINDAATFSETHADHQVMWPSSSYHQNETETLLREARDQKQIRSLSKVAHDPRQVDHRENTVIVFPGQGAQFVGMGSKLLHIQTVKDIFDSASEILKYDVSSLCLEGPPEKLNSTRYCQPALVVASLAAVEALYQKDPENIKSCIATAGFSVGEITALIFSGVLSLEDGLRLVQARAEAMEYASQLEPSGMMTVFFGAKHQLGLACQAARKWTDENGYAHGKAVCQIANHLYAGAKTLAGHEQALRFIESNKNDFGIRKIKRLPVSGAFHTPLMEDAVQPFREELAMVKLNPPRISVYSNFSGEEYKDTMQISKTLPKQIVSAVKWEQIVNRLYNYEMDAYYPTTFECGPGSSLTYILNKCNGKAGKLASCTQV